MLVELLDDEEELEDDESEDLVVDFSEPEAFVSEEPLSDELLSDERESVR